MLQRQTVRSLIAPGITNILLQKTISGSFAAIVIYEGSDHLSPVSSGITGRQLLYLFIASPMPLSAHSRAASAAAGKACRNRETSDSAKRPIT